MEGLRVRLLILFAAGQASTVEKRLAEEIVKLFVLGWSSHCAQFRRFVLDDKLVLGDR